MRILVVEDEHRIAAAIKKGLEIENYAVDTAYNGTEGYDMAAGEEYDLIILDIMLPGMNGMELCRRLRSNKIQTPILMLTAKGQVTDKVDGLDAGADDYLTKPFSFEELVARVRALIRRPRKLINPQLKASGITINTTTFEVLVKNNKVDLSGKEYAILEYLVRNAGRIITKVQLINHVWDYDANVLPNTVEVNIRNLRKKMGEDLIQTKRGFGYIIDKEDV